MINVSVCIPSYNRPKELRKLLDSIDSKESEKIEIVICEDKSPKRFEIREEVKKFIGKTNYSVNYIENEENKGYDRNLQELIRNANGDFIVFMGDDDEFVPEALDKYMKFLEENNGLEYILKTARTIYANGDIEEFRYFDKTKFFEPGFESFVTLFRKSVFISGFTIKRKSALEFETDNFNGSLLYQLYLLAEVCLKGKSAYCDILLTQQYEGGTPFFGSSETEKKLYTPGTITVDNSINFVGKYFEITKYLDDKYGFDSTRAVKEDMSKYSYPILAIQREKGIKEFKKYVIRLRNLGIDNTFYFNIYYVGLLLLGKKNCDKGIRILKKVIGRSPKL
jgi:glycosyltransferase involved in cell wall biosynthesis